MGAFSRMREADRVRGKELMCDHCGCTRWKCLTKFDGECCDHCEHPEPMTDRLSESIDRLESEPPRADLLAAYHRRTDHGRDGTPLDGHTCNCRDLFTEYAREVLGTCACHKVVHEARKPHASTQIGRGPR